MNIRKKITIASILMILIPVIVSALLCFGIVFYRGDSTLTRLKTLYDDENGLLNIQSILFHYKDDILHYTPSDTVFSSEELREAAEEATEEDDDEDMDEEDLREAEAIQQVANIDRAFGGLIRQLTSLGYYYQITCNDIPVISNLPDHCKAELVTLAGKEYNTINNFAVANNEHSAVKRTYSNEEKRIEILTYCDTYIKKNGQLSQAVQDILSILAIFVLILLIAIVCSIFFLTRWLSSGIKDSLDQLSEGVKQIGEGNLDYRIHNSKKDEIGKACDEFDEMADYLEQSVDERTRYEKMRRQMLAGISHDLRTPLTSIKAYVSGLKDGLANTDEKKQRYYDALLTRTGDLEALIDNLSIFSQFDRGTYHFVMEPIEMKEFLTDFLQENEVDFQQNHIETRILSWPESSVFIEGDRRQLRRVLGNLTDNSIKYREKNHTCLDISLHAYGDTLQLIISDDGPGVLPEERERIFDSFYRGDQARQNPGNGSGLGLSIVREILHGHGASIRAEDGPDHCGLQLTITFPLKGGSNYEKNSDY